MKDQVASQKFSELLLFWVVSIMSTTKYDVNVLFFNDLYHYNE